MNEHKRKMSQKAAPAVGSNSSLEAEPISLTRRITHGREPSDVRSKVGHVQRERIERCGTVKPLYVIFAANWSLSLSSTTRDACIPEAYDLAQTQQLTTPSSGM